MALLQPLIDSDAGRVLASAMHTLGAIGLLGSLIGYLAWHRHLRHGHHHAGVLAWSSFLGYLAIVVNLLGGFMRTYETGHPGLSEFGSEPWVRAIAIKHVFLLAGMGALVYLFEAAAPRQLQALRDGGLAQHKGTGHAVGVLVVVLGIVVAALLGAVSSVTAIGGGDEAMDHGVDLTAPTRYQNATGQLTSTPLSPATSTGSFEVPEDAADLEATLTWAPSQSNLAVELRGPSGAPLVQGAGTGRLGRLPEPGTWTYTVSSPDPVVSAQWTLALAVPVAPRHTVTIAPGEFYEVNTQAPEGGGLAWDWRADAAVAFNVHSHFDGEVQLLADLAATHDRGNVTASRAGGHSYLWANDGSETVTLAFRVWGPFTVDSVYAS